MPRKLGAARTAAMDSVPPVSHTAWVLLLYSLPTHCPLFHWFIIATPTLTAIIARLKPMVTRT